jgi:hypothetical protein
MVNNGPKQIKTSSLKTMIDKAKEELIPLFRLSEEEISLLRKPVIRRWLNANEYPEFPRNFHGYSPIDNFFYFPNKDPGYLSHNAFDYASVRHEVGHYLHYQINKNLLEEKRKVLLGILSYGIYELEETVAEYGNIILKARNYKEYPYNQVFKNVLILFNNYGPLLLPKISRMTFQEAKTFLIKE